MSKPLDDRAVLVRTLQALETVPHCSFFACPGPDHKPVLMATCAQAATVWDLRNYMERHGGWCPEHAQELSRCHPKDAREAAYQVLHCSDSTVSYLCHCRPVVRLRNGKDDTENSLAMVRRALLHTTPADELVCEHCGRKIRPVPRLADSWEDEFGQMVCPASGQGHRPTEEVRA